MKKEEIRDGINAIGEYLCLLTKVGEDDKPDEDNKRILHFYKVLDGMSEVLRKIPDDEYYPITSLCKEDIIACYEGSDEEADVIKAVEELEPMNMEYIAKKMADSFCDCCYWEALKCRFEFVKYDEWKKEHKKDE